MRMQNMKNPISFKDHLREDFIYIVLLALSMTANFVTDKYYMTSIWYYVDLCFILLFGLLFFKEIWDDKKVRDEAEVKEEIEIYEDEMNEEANNTKNSYNIKRHLNKLLLVLILTNLVIAFIKR
jgi:hypothetical protein